MKGRRGKGGLPHTGVPEIVQPPLSLSTLSLGINVDLTPIKFLRLWLSRYASACLI